MGGRAGQTLAGRQRVAQGGETAARVEQRRRLHGETFEKGVASEKKRNKN